MSLPRKLFRPGEFYAQGGTKSGLDWGMSTSTYVRVAHGVYAPGPEPPTRLEVAIGQVYGSDRVADQLVAATLHDLGGIPWRLPPQKRLRRPLIAGELVTLHSVRCTNGLQTIVDIAPLLKRLGVGDGE